MNELLLKKCFLEALGIAPEKFTDTLAYNSLKEWDSVGHMALVAALETEFGLMLDTDEIIALSSVAVARQILGRHGVTFP